MSSFRFYKVILFLVVFQEVTQADHSTLMEILFCRHGCQPN